MCACEQHARSLRDFLARPDAAVELLEEKADGYACESLRSITRLYRDGKKTVYDAVFRAASKADQLQLRLSRVSPYQHDCV